MKLRSNKNTATSKKSSKTANHLTSVKKSKFVYVNDKGN